MLLVSEPLFSSSLTIFFPFRSSLISEAVRVSYSSSPFAIVCKSFSLALIIFFAVASPFLTKTLTSLSIIRAVSSDILVCWETEWPRKTSSWLLSYLKGPSLSENPNSFTILLAKLVACWISLPAPVVILSLP